MGKRKTVRAREGGKKSRVSKPSSKKWEKYESGDKLSKQEFCMRCGEGVFMAKHKDRKSCGKCGYTVFEN